VNSVDVCYLCANMPDIAAIGKFVNQIMLPVIGVALVLGLIFIVVSVLAFGDGSTVYVFLAALYVIAVIGGVLAGVQADYKLVMSMVQWVGILGSVILFYVGRILSDPMAAAVSTALSVLILVVSLVPRVAVLGSTAVMLGASLFVFEAARRGYLVGLSFVPSLAWMAGAALLLGNGFSEVTLPDPPPTPDPTDAQPL
jgi:hypothetical protein